MDFSKRMISDIRWLLWVVTIAAIGLAFYCIHLGYLGSLPWITSLVALPWGAHGIVCSFYLNMAKSDHSSGGITYDLAMKEQALIDQALLQRFPDTIVETSTIDLNGEI